MRSVDGVLPVMTHSNLYYKKLQYNFTQPNVIMKPRRLEFLTL